MAASRPSPLEKAKLFGLVGGDLRRVEDFIELESISCAEVVTEISAHLMASGGKRLRPALVLLSARACGAEGNAPIRMAAVMELIHVATLVHDDVIDVAETRRGRPSVNVTWGNQVSVLAGDWLYMQAFRLAVEQRNFAILDMLISLTQRMVEGELMQADMLGRLDVTEQQNEDLIERKTASLLAACSRLGAMLAESDARIEAGLETFGWNLGLAFQLVDDVLDFEGTESVLGKPVGNDLREGKVTLPVILALQSCTRTERIAVETVMREGGYESVSLRQVQEILDRYGTLAAVRQRALLYCERALEGLEPLPETRFKRALVTAAEQWGAQRAN